MFSDIFHTARGRFATHRLMPPGCKPGESDARKLLVKYLFMQGCSVLKRILSDQDLWCVFWGRNLSEIISNATKQSGFVSL